MVKIACLLVEHEHNDPSARYTLYDRDTFNQIQMAVDLDGALDDDFPVITEGKTKASFSKVSDLVKFCDIFGYVIENETHTWSVD
jgi:hypothetical protein